jgi:hypothetical protein
VVVRAVLIAWALVATAHAQPRTEAGLVWQAPDSCPDVAEVRARIERRLGTTIERAVHGVEVEIAVEGEGGGRRFVARVDLRAVTVANEVRVLSSARCSELTDAVAVVIARIAAENRAPAEAAAERAQIAVRAPPVVVPRVWGGGLRAIGVSGVGTLPGIGLGGHVAGYVRHGAGFAELGATRWMRGHQVLHTGAPGRVDVRLDVATLRLGWGPEHLPLRGWVAGELGSIQGEGVALEDGRSGSGRWIAAGAGFGVAWPMSTHTRLVGLVELAVPLVRARFLLQDGTELYRPAAANARCGFGFEVGWR